MQRGWGRRPRRASMAPACVVQAPLWGKTAGVQDRYRNAGYRTQGQVHNVSNGKAGAQEEYFALFAVTLRGRDTRFPTVHMAWVTAAARYGGGAAAAAALRASHSTPHAPPHCATAPVSSSDAADFERCRHRRCHGWARLAGRRGSGRSAAGGGRAEAGCASMGKKEVDWLGKGLPRAWAEHGRRSGKCMCMGDEQRGDTSMPQPRLTPAGKSRLL